MVWANSQFAAVFFFFLLLGFFAKATGRTVRPIWTNEGSKHVILLKEVPFGGLNDVTLNFGGKIPQKLKFWSREYNFKTTWPLMTIFLQEVRVTNEASWVVPWLTQTNPRWRRPPSLISEKCQ